MARVTAWKFFTVLLGYSYSNLRSKLTKQFSQILLRIHDIYMHIRMYVAIYIPCVPFVCKCTKSNNVHTCTHFSHT